MASDQKFVDFIIEQIDTSGQVTGKKMFGEYALYFGDKLFALICDNKLYIKPTLSGRAFIKDVVEAPPYPGAKPSFLIEEKLEDRDWMKKLVALTVKELPEPKPKKEKKKKEKKKKEEKEKEKEKKKKKKVETKTKVKTKTKTKAKSK